MLETISISRFKATCLRLLDTVKKTGHPILVTRRGEPIALVSPPPSATDGDWLGCLQDRVHIHGDIVSPATAPEEWEALETRA